MKSMDKSTSLKGSEPQPQQPLVTLDPLLKDGEDALNPKGVERIKKVTLSEVEVDHENALHERVIKTSDDLYATPPGKHVKKDPIPKHGKLKYVVLTFELVGAAAPFRLYLRPPCTLQYEASSLPAPVAQWLFICHFTQSLISQSSEAPCTPCLTSGEPSKKSPANPPSPSCGENI